MGWQVYITKVVMALVDKSMVCLEDEEKKDDPVSDSDLSKVTLEPQGNIASS